MPVRAAIVLLVLLNVATAAWWLLHESPAPEPRPAAPAGAAWLRLADAGTPDDGRDATPPARSAARATPRKAAGSAAAGTGAAAACEGGEGPAAGWRVYLPALPSADIAQATAASVGAAGFSDYLVVRDGADANTIALGRYSTEAAARRRMASLRAAGFAARCARIQPSTPA
jgi:hypothetical protein